MLENTKELLVMIINLLKDVRYELHENNERYIRDVVGHIGVPDVEHKSNPFKGKGVIASEEPFAILSHKSNILVEFDEIQNVPKVYVNGVDIADLEHNHSGLQVLHIDWVTNDECKQPKKFYLRYIDECGEHAIIDRGDGEGGVKIYG